MRQAELCSSAFVLLSMPLKKAYLPSKICVVCNRPFTWRKKWQAVWNEVKYCSEKCRSQKAKKIDTTN